MVINNWIESNRIIDVDYPDKTQEIIDRIIETHCHFSVIRDIRKSG